jgi:hypothetical protein
MTNDDDNIFELSVELAIMATSMELQLDMLLGREVLGDIRPQLIELRNVAGRISAAASVLRDNLNHAH